jgi:hypothetical protein
MLRTFGQQQRKQTGVQVRLLAINDWYIVIFIIYVGQPPRNMFDCVPYTQVNAPGHPCKVLSYLGMLTLDAVHFRPAEEEADRCAGQAGQLPRNVFDCVHEHTRTYQDITRHLCLALA